MAQAAFLLLALVNKFPEQTTLIFEQRRARSKYISIFLRTFQFSNGAKRLDHSLSFFSAFSMENIFCNVTDDFRTKTVMVTQLASNRPAIKWRSRTGLNLFFKPTRVFALRSWNMLFAATYQLPFSITFQLAAHCRSLRVLGYQMSVPFFL